jgi:hypothetical protein
MSPYPILSFHCVFFLFVVRTVHILLIYFTANKMQGCIVLDCAWDEAQTPHPSTKESCASGLVPSECQCFIFSPPPPPRPHGWSRHEISRNLTFVFLLKIISDFRNSEETSKTKINITVTFVEILNKLLLMF